MSRRQRDLRRITTGLLWVGPNLLGFFAFTALPLLISLWMALSDWDLTRHNFLIERQLGAAYHLPVYVGLGNFARLFQDPRFWSYFGNTLFLMMIIPFNIAGSLVLALLLSKPGDAGGGRGRRTLIFTLLAIGAAFVLLLLGLRAEAMVILLGSLFTAVLALGAVGGSTVYRTLFYLPNFTAGVAVFLLWKRLYSVSGPINNALAGPIDALGGAARSAPPALVTGMTWLLLVAAAALIARGLRQLRRSWSDGELGSAALIVTALVVLLPALLALSWWRIAGLSFGVMLLAVLAGVALVYQALQLRRGRFVGAPIDAFDGLGAAFLSSMISSIAALVLVGVAAWVYGLPALASTRTGLQPPDWLNAPTWAKPALMIMAFWTAVGSNNMLLYLAGISNIPPELYEAADIDGASPSQRFWNITWPQLAPTTFFIFIMSVIGGLQGGFESARVMTEGAAGTTSLSYFIYTSAFMDLSLGMGSAIAWVLFALVLVATLFNWKVGNQYVNE